MEDPGSLLSSCVPGHVQLDLLLLSLCPFLHQQLILSWNNSEWASLAASFQHQLRIYSSGELSITSQTSLSQPLLPLLLIPLQLGSTFNFSKSFHIHFLIWPLQQSREVGRASIIIPIWKTEKWNTMHLSGRPWVMWHAGGPWPRGPEWDPPHSPPVQRTSQWTQSDCNGGHVNFLVLVFAINTVLGLLQGPTTQSMVHGQAVTA